jgi:hypothetical protein
MVVRGLCGTDERAEALEHGFDWSLLRALYRMELGLPARLDQGRRRELCEDVPFAPRPLFFVRPPFGVVLARVQGAMQAVGARSRVLLGCPQWTRGQRSTFTTWQARQTGAARRDHHSERAVRVHACAEPAEVLDILHAAV